MNNYREDFSFQTAKEKIQHRLSTNENIDHKEQRCLEYVLSSSPAGNPQKVIDAIDSFCFKHWMMNLGPEKAKIALKALKLVKPRVVVEIGGYCGYSALTFAHNTPEDCKIYSIEINEVYAGISKRILQHAGLAHKVQYLIGDVEAAKEKLKSLHTIDFLFVDHWKDVYLRDFKIIESIGVIKKGSVVVGDNIIYPGSPDYLQFFKDRNDYESTLYHSYLEYSDRPDAVLVSLKL